MAPAGAYLADAAPIPAPAVAPLVILTAGMGAGKTEAIAAHLAPLAAAGVPVLLPSHRQALGQANAKRVGPAMAPRCRGDRSTLLRGWPFCWDSWLPVECLADQRNWLGRRPGGGWMN
jgi:hypothetical protein